MSLDLNKIATALGVTIKDVVERGVVFKATADAAPKAFIAQTQKDAEKARRGSPEVALKKIAPRAEATVTVADRASKRMYAKAILEAIAKDASPEVKVWSGRTVTPAPLPITPSEGDIIR